MKKENLPAYLEEELAYPVDQATVIDRIGDVEIEAPDRDDTETIGTIIRSLGQDTYDSPEELYTTILGSVSDEHIGRKYYDDRGQHGVDSSEGPGEERDVSF